PDFKADMARLADAVKKGISMIRVPDVSRTLEWYASIGFTEIARYPDEGPADFGMVCFGRAELMIVPGGKTGEHDVSLWFYNDQIEQLYQLLKSRQLETAR